MSNILFLYERDMPTVSDMRYRFADIFSIDKSVDHIFKSVNSICPSDLTWLDVLVLIRADNYYSYQVADRVSKYGKTVVFFMDDDLFCVPKNVLPTIPWKKKALLKNLKLSDVFLSSSDYLINKYGDLTKGKRKVRIDSATNKEDIIKSLPPKKESDRISIVYAAGREHGVLFEKYILPILPRIEKEFGQRISLTFFGAKPNIPDEYNFDIAYIGSMPLKEYRQKMIESQFDVGIAPLNDDEFSKCKYFNKYIEYTITGVVGIYSKVEPYTFVIKDGVNGFLAGNDPDSWFEKIKESLDRKKLRKMFNNAKEHIVNNFSVEMIAERLKKNIPEFYQEHNDVPIKTNLRFVRLKYKMLRIFDTVYLVLYYLKRGGIKEVKRKIRTHKEESKAYR